MEIYNASHIVELEADLMNPQKPSKDFKKPQVRHSNPLSEMFIDQKKPPTLSKDQIEVHDHIHKFYNDLFANKD